MKAEVCYDLAQIGIEMEDLISRGQFYRGQGDVMKT